MDTNKLLIKECRNKNKNDKIDKKLIVCVISLFLTMIYFLILR